MDNQSSSPKFSLNKEDLYKTGRGTLITFAGILIVVFGQILLDVDLGNWNLIIAPLSPALIELGRRFIRDYSPVDLSK